MCLVYWSIECVEFELAENFLGRLMAQRSGNVKEFDKSLWLLCKNLQHFQILTLWVGVDKIYNLLQPNNSLTWYIVVHKYKAMLPISIAIVTCNYYYLIKTVIFGICKLNYPCYELLIEYLFFRKLIYSHVLVHYVGCTKCIITTFTKLPKSSIKLIVHLLFGGLTCEHFKI